MAVVRLQGDMLTIPCPCGGHTIPVSRERQHGSWHLLSTDLDYPTISPSVLATARDDELGINEVCHFFLENGVLRFLTDSTHELAGESYRLPRLPEPGDLDPP